jgi:hypothetical protein
MPLMAFACSDAGTGPLPPVLPPPPAIDLAAGQHLFDNETFGGNGRTCLTCHTTASGTITLEDVTRRLAAKPNDELFLHDAFDDGVTGTSRIAAHATIRVELQLPSYVTLADDPAQRTIVMNRGVPSTLNAPALDGKGLIALMLDLRDPNLQRQALGAIRGHAQSTVEPTQKQLDDIAAFQQTDERFFSSAALRAAASGYFHDNSAKTLRQVVDHYGDVFFDRVRIAGANIILTEQDRQDIVAFLERF